ncbi:hypothetical protein T484DRAFT_3646017 [Baffinella frigidus]|nr:hypothetical protein T484DRAFT_3646017 [Cryptophyta sp. CCMP2293]
MRWNSHKSNKERRRGRALISDCGPTPEQIKHTSTASHAMNTMFSRIRSSVARPKRPKCPSILEEQHPGRTAQTQSGGYLESDASSFDPATMQLPHVSLPFLHSDPYLEELNNRTPRRSSGQTQAASVRAPCSGASNMNVCDDDLLQELSRLAGVEDRSDAGMFAWLNEATDHAPRAHRAPTRRRAQRSASANHDATEVLGSLVSAGDVGLEGVMARKQQVH